MKKKFPLKVMLVDDCEITTQRLEQILSRHDGKYDVNSFQNPLDALESMKGETYDIIFSDINMPQLFGDDLVRTSQRRARKRKGQWR